MLSHVLALNAINLPCRVDNRLPFAPARSDICLDLRRGGKERARPRNMRNEAGRNATVVRPQRITTPTHGPVNLFVSAP